MPGERLDGQITSAHLNCQSSSVQGLDFSLKSENRFLEVDVYVMIKMGAYPSELMVLPLSNLENDVTLLFGI